MCRTAARCSSDGREEMVFYGASNPGLVVTSVKVFVKAVNWSPHEEAIEVAAGSLYVGQQPSHGDRKTTNLRSGGSGNTLLLASFMASIVFFNPFVTIPPLPVEPQCPITHAAIVLISFGRTSTLSTLSNDWPDRWKWISQLPEFNHELGKFPFSLGNSGCLP